MEPNDTTAAPTMIRDLPATDRPRERLRDAGASALNNAELIAILLRTGNARKSALDQAGDLLARYGGIAGLARCSFSELCRERGIGEAKAAQIKAAIELGTRAAAASARDAVTVFRSPDDLANLVMADMSLLDHEEVRVALLDTRNRLMSIAEVYRGSVHSAVVRTSELLRVAVRANAPAIICLHNHPSGDPTPSAPDIKMTQQLLEAARAMDIALLDHLVIAGGRYVSMRAAHLGFPHGP
jgi:DNA repair protein RadC